VFRDRLDGARLEVAIGLESAEASILDRLNKRMTRDDFARAAGYLRANGIGVRVFLLVKPPFVDEATALEQVSRSVEFAFASGADVVSLVPTRPGNGALDRLARAGLFTPPTLTMFEDAVDAAFAFRPSGGRIFADLWGLERFCDDPGSFDARAARMAAMNLGQQVLPRVGAAVSSRQRP
jgi:radical SAM enzyme (TIGR01210 family)